MMDRRAFLASLAALGAVAIMDDGWVELSRFDPPQVDAALLHSMEHINRHFAARRELVPPPLLRQGLVDHLDYLRGLLGQSLPSDVQARLLVIVSDAARRMAWNSYQLGYRQQARDDLQLAHSLARESYSGERLAAALVYQADVERDTRPDNPASALRLAETAVLAAGPTAGPQITMAVRATRGEMYAAAGDLFASMVDLHAAEEVMVTKGPWEPGQGLVPPHSQAELAAIKGSAELRLGSTVPAQAHRAVDTLAGAFREMTSRVSWRATVQANLGAAYAQCGEAEQAATTLMAALSLAQRDGAKHNVDRVRGIRQRLLKVDIPAVRELDERLLAQPST
jgi:tetratricopeptide (TPR) repeat protein